MSLTKSLIEFGYFPPELPPAFTTESFASDLDATLGYLVTLGPPNSKCGYHSIPRHLHLRRLLGLPNPAHQLKLAATVEQNWAAIEAHIQRSPLSLTTPLINSSPPRALALAKSFEEFDVERVLRSSTSRYVLRADLSRFYHSLYTHSIPWALHTKAIAKAQRNNRALFGNAIDTAVRNAQDQQTLGIPVGPDTSILIAEILAVAIDIELLSRRPGLEGLRFIDDYYLYFRTRHEAESALADLYNVAKQFEVEINPLKTSIQDLPEALQPAWKTEVRSLVLRDSQERQDLLALFSCAFQNATKHPGSSVLKFAVKQSAGFTVSRDNWPMYESFLLGSLVAEPSLAPVLAPILIKYSNDGYELDRAKLVESCGEVASFHARLNQGFEVAWSLWICKLFSIALPEKAMNEVSNVDDPVVALLALDHFSQGRGAGLDVARWSSCMLGEHLYSEYWLLAYEAFAKGWLPSADGSNYVDNDDFFGTLRASDVSFYDEGTLEPSSDDEWLTGY